MIDNIKNHIKYVINYTPKDNDSLINFKRKYFSKKGILNELFNSFKNIKENKSEIGKLLNDLKNSIIHKLKIYNNVTKVNFNNNTEIDFSLPGLYYGWGNKHPITLISEDIISIFHNIGFSLIYGPEIEDDWHNFTALNFPINHSARDMQDTFFIKNDKNNHLNDIMLRTHTSSVQIRFMEYNSPPFKHISLGTVYRNENISSRSHCYFNQLEGFYVDNKLTLINLKEILIYFINEFFGSKTKFRFRSSYFPFTEPSFEIDILCLLCEGIGCSMCKNTGWCEILGCGVIEKNVLKNCNIDINQFNGLAFGIGIERIASLKYRVDDLRLFSENNLDFLFQFN